MKINSNSLNKLNLNKTVNIPSFRAYSSVDVFLKKDNSSARIPAPQETFLQKQFSTLLFKKEFYSSKFIQSSSMYDKAMMSLKDPLSENATNVLNKLRFLEKEMGGDNYIFSSVKPYLTCDKLDVEGLKNIFQLFEENGMKNQNSKRVEFLQLLINYDDYESLDNSYENEKNKLLLISDIENFSKKFFDISELENIKQYSNLTRFNLIRDLKRYGVDETIERMQLKLSSKYVEPFNVDKKYSDDFYKAISPENLYKSLNNTNLKKYYSGFPLKYPRKDFISDFNSLIKDLSQEEKKEVFSYFNFIILGNKDMLNYPNTNNPFPTNSSKNVVKAILDGTEIINKFMLDNKVQLADGDIYLEKTINSIIKMYPEFIVQIGKMQHRNDSVDFHVFDNLQRIIKNPMFYDLNEKEQQILIIANLFHDFSKLEYSVDVEHPYKSANYAKDIITKSNLCNDEQERIYNLIRYSHWMTDDSLSDEDIAVRFRRPNDFKMAQIFANADCESAGFKYPIDKRRINNIQTYIDKINQTAIPLFADSFPVELKNCQTSVDGLKILDFSDLDKDVSQYGFAEGKKVKDLRFLFHSYDTPEALSRVCDKSKEVCLSTMFLPLEEIDNVVFNGVFTRAILSAPNSNICLADRAVQGTGLKKNIVDFSRFVLSNIDDFEWSYLRKKYSNGMKKSLNISDEEYVELYQQIGNLKNVEEIQDVYLSTNRILKKQDIISAIQERREFLYFDKNRESKSKYSNEVDVLNPKLEAFVIPKSLLITNNLSDVNNKYHKTFEKIREICIQKNIPIVLV